MNCLPIITHLRKHIDLSEEECAFIAARLRHFSVKKKQVWLHQGQVARDVAFVLSGCLKSYSTDDNGFEHIVQFAPEEWWITDMYSFISRKNGNLTIEAILNSEILLLSREDQLELFNTIPKLERYFRILTENALISARQRVNDNLSLTAKERYARFCKTYPMLINEIPQKLIAAYIGVTPEFLSKIRSQY